MTTFARLLPLLLLTGCATVYRAAGYPPEVLRDEAPARGAVTA